MAHRLDFDARWQAAAANSLMTRAGRGDSRWLLWWWRRYCAAEEIAERARKQFERNYEVESSQPRKTRRVFRG
jgi:hypothetical protein